MNSIQFNIVLGFFSLISFFLSNLISSVTIPFYLIAICSFFLYVAEFWAFLFKLKIARIRELVHTTKGNPNLELDLGSEPGCMMVYAFLLRFVFRIVLGMIPVLALGEGIDKDMNNIQIVFMIIIVLFELFNMMYSMYDTHIFKLTGEYDVTEEEIKETWDKEKAWRTKNYPLLANEQAQKKEMLATIILLLMAFVTTHFLWGSMNNEFIDFIIRTKTNHESVLFATLSVTISCFVLCLFFLMPVRLAFWIEEKMKADEAIELKRYRLSLIFAGFSICSPSLIQLFVSFVLN